MCSTIWQTYWPLIISVDQHFSDRMDSLMVNLALRAIAGLKLATSSMLFDTSADSSARCSSETRFICGKTEELK